MMKKNVLKSCLIMLVLLGAISFFPCNACALQGLAPSGPIGGTDINQALIPPPGLYGGIVVGNLNFLGWADGRKNEIDAGENAQIAAIGFSYVWDTKIWGGSVLSSICTGWQDQTWTVGGSPKDDFSGMIDIYTDLFFWGRFFPSQAFSTQPKGSFIPYGLAVGGGLGITLPTGTYEEDEPNNVGSNVYTISPSVALTYTVPSLLGKTLGDATQFSARVFYNEYTEQKDRNYRNGDILNIDYSITQIKGAWQYGIAGNKYWQVTDDEFTNGTTGFENRTSLFSLGGIVGYNFALNGHPFFAKVKANFTMEGKNTSTSNIVFLSIGTKF